MANFTTDMVPEVEAMFSKSVNTVIGVLLAIITVFGIVENFTVFGMFFKCRKELNSRTTYLLMSLSISDGVMALIGGTMYTISSLNNKWPFKYEGCVFYGVVVFLTGCTDITHLTAIALDRMFAIASPIRYRAWAHKPFLTIFALTFCWLHGLVWALLPLTGLSSYAYEGETSCSVDWLREDTASQIYMILIFTCVYLVPNVLMISSYGFIYMTIKTVNRRFSVEYSAASRKKKTIETRLAINFSLLYIVYMMAWTPYAIVSFVGAFGNGLAIPMTARGIPAVLAKCSFVLNPLLYVASNKDHRKKLRDFLGLPPAVEPEESKELNKRRSDDKSNSVGSCNRNNTADSSDKSRTSGPM